MNVTIAAAEVLAATAEGAAARARRRVLVLREHDSQNTVHARRDGCKTSGWGTRRRNALARSCVGASTGADQSTTLHSLHLLHSLLCADYIPLIDMYDTPLIQVRAQEPGV